MMMHGVFWVCHSLALLVLASNDTVGVRVQEGAGFAEIVLEWPAPVTHSSAVDGRELLLQFGRPISPAGAEDLAARLPEWMEGVSFGFDTMLIRAARDVDYDVRAEGNMLRIRMAARGGTEPTAAVEQQEGRIRLRILEAQLRILERKNGVAAGLLEALVKEHPQNIPALSNLAQAEQQIGRWRRAHTLYSRVLQLDPRNEDARELRSSLLAEHAARIRFDAEMKSIGGDRIERIGRVSAHAFLAGYFRLGAAVDRNHTTASGRRYDRSRGELYLQQDFDGGTELKISVFGTRRQTGGGVRAGHTDSGGRLYVQADYRRPFWEFLETIAGYGTRDRAEVHRDQRLGVRVDARITAAFNRYGLPDAGDIARSLAFDGGLALALSRGNPYLGIEYSFDAESVRRLRPETIPLVSREVHALSAAVQGRLSARLSAEAFAGYVRDRLGERGRGPFAGGRLTLGGPSRLGLQIWYDRRLNSVATGQIVNRTGAYLYWRFQ